MLIPLLFGCFCLTAYIVNKKVVCKFICLALNNNREQLKFKMFCLSRYTLKIIFYIKFNKSVCYFCLNIRGIEEGCYFS